MRARTAALDDVLTGSHSRRLFVDVFHGSDRVLQGLEMEEWELEGDLSQEVKLSGSATISYQSVSGESLVPSGTQGVLSPFRARLLLTMEIQAGDFTELVTLGWARLSTVPAGVDYWADTRYGKFVVASFVKIEWAGLEDYVRRRGFRSPEQPPSVTSTYAELRRVTGMTVVQTVADAVLPTGITYDTSSGGRLKGVQLLWDNLGCIGAINPAGQWYGIPKAAGDPVGTLTKGRNGTIIDVGYQVETDNIYNCVVGVFEDANRNPIYSVAEVKDGPLSTSGLYGENTLQYTSSVPTTQAAADATTQSLLTQSIGGQTYEVPITCISNPVFELGDVLAVSGHTRPLQGRLIKYRMTNAALMDVTLEVQRTFG
ncbi:hypothetical protein [uncultured Leifsonia sp.]|uniref:hypothetical protein n=1 Tax=uncultured Leifsonia sp. TaxID=340359 RepID=UPI0009260D6A|nr:hypothetical protein [uncultured Leifsonia sp.]OJX72836.1 MAG: hypothetical protein BGO91_13790 [Leifsonia sp. 71-9]